MVCYQIHIRQRDGYIGSAFPSPTRFSCKTSNKLVEVLHSCTAIRQRAWGIQQGWILVLGKLVAAATPLPEALVREDGRTHVGTQKGATGCLGSIWHSASVLFQGGKWQAGWAITQAVLYTLKPESTSKNEAP